MDFAQARYFAATHGRFSSPDNFLNDAEATDPRSWNLYAYVRNNPLKYSDPTGEKVYVRFWERAGEDELIDTTLEYRDGKLYTLDGEEYAGTNEYALQALDHLTTLSKDPVLGLMIDQLVASKKKHTIQVDLEDPANNAVVPTDDGTNVFWSGRDSALTGDDGIQGTGRYQRAIYSLAHELLGHSWFMDQGRERTGALNWHVRRHGRPAFYQIGSNYEIDAIDVENRARFLLGDFDFRTTLAGVDISDLLKIPGGPERPEKPTLKLTPRQVKPR